jgi:hypothetical protein
VKRCRGNFPGIASEGNFSKEKSKILFKIIVSTELTMERLYENTSLCFEDIFKTDYIKGSNAKTLYSSLALHMLLLLLMGWMLPVP